MGWKLFIQVYCINKLSFLLFRSIAHGFYGDQERHNELRQKAMNYALQRLDQFEWTKTILELSEDTSLRNYLLERKQKALHAEDRERWGRMEDIIFIAHFLRRNIIVVSEFYNKEGTLSENVTVYRYLDGITTLDVCGFFNLINCK